MRTVIYMILIALVFFAPVESQEIAKLEPVQGVAVYVEDGQVVLETDTQDRGIGKTVREALENMKVSTPSVIYLDTAEYLLVSSQAREYVDALRAYLKPSVRVGTYWGGSVKDETEYVDVHGKLPKLKEWNAEE